MSKQGKKYIASAAKIDAAKKYPLKEALELVISTAHVKFDETVDLTFNLGIDPKQSDQMVRGATPLPHGLGKTVRILVIAKGEKAKEAEEAGADYVGAEDMIEKIQGGWLEFDKVVATPDVMAQVGKIGKILGTKGLMPNPKLGTVTFDLKKAVSELRSGKSEFRADKAGVVQAPVGKVSFGIQKLLENTKTLVESIQRMKPQTSKGVYVKKLNVSSTMGVNVKVETLDLKNYV